MARKREDGFDLVPASEFLPGIVQQVKPSPPAKPATKQGKHHYTRAKQIDDLLAIREDAGNPDMGFLTRIMALCSLPRTDQGSKLQYIRENGPFTLVMIAGGKNKLPFGILPRLLLAWVCTEAVRTQSRELHLGHSLSEFMRELGMLSSSGGKRSDRTRLKTQIDRLFACNVELIYETKGYKKAVSSLIADERELWWDYKTPDQDTLWQSWIRLGEKLFREIIEHPVPLDMRILKAMRRSPLGLDLYMWLSYKVYAMNQQGKGSERLSWHLLYEQFGADPSKANDKRAVDYLRADVLRELDKLKVCWPALNFATPKGFLEIRGSSPSIPALPSRGQVKAALESGLKIK